VKVYHVSALLIGDPGRPTRHRFLSLLVVGCCGNDPRCVGDADIGASQEHTLSSSRSPPLYSSSLHTSIYRAECVHIKDDSPLFHTFISHMYRRNSLILAIA
jgi:hypothetical protein